MDYSNKALRPGTVLTGRKSYRIERVLGAGGFGITYLASTTVVVDTLRAKAMVAIKEHFMGDYCEREGDTGSVTCPGTEVSRTLVGNSLKDFMAEARRLAEYGKDHPNIVKVNEIFEANGTAYYVMEYLEGQSLADYVKTTGPLDGQSIRDLVFPIVDAVAYLHGKHLTHLDIKPGNIMLAEGEDGRIRPALIDFGLSKHYNADGSATSTVNTMACSDGYAPAEQYMGIRTFSPTADVYAIGATMLSVATGRIPTRSGDWPAGEPAATIAALPLDERLRIVMTCAMAYRREERYADAGAMLSALGVSSARTECVVTKPITEKKDGEKARQLDDPEKPNPEKPDPIEPERKLNRKLLITGVVAMVLIILGIALWPGGSDGPADPYIAATDTLAVDTPVADSAAIVPVVTAKETAEAEAIAEPVVDDEPVSIAMVEQKPSFPGGEAAMYAWLSDNIVYPPAASEEGIQGRVVVEFVVGKDGSITNARVVRTRHPTLDKEALRVIKAMPNWIPGRHNGQPVKVTYTLPVTFKLQ